MCKTSRLNDTAAAKTYKEDNVTVEKAILYIFNDKYVCVYTECVYTVMVKSLHIPCSICKMLIMLTK